MKTENFTNLIRAITGKPFSLSFRLNFRETGPCGDDILPETVYFVSYALPLSGRTVGFDWKTAKTDERMLRSFINAYCSKYREPNPASYVASPYGGRAWSDMTPEQRERAFYHHADHMFSRDRLLQQIQARFDLPEIAGALRRWGFYETEYGIGIFCFWQTRFVLEQMDAMRRFLSEIGVPAKEEFSDARWVYRFRIEASKPVHTSILNRFSAA